MKDSLKGISSFGRKAIVLAGLIGFEKGNQVKVSDAAVDVPTVSYDFLAICLSSFFIERWPTLSTSIRQAKAFLQLVERHCLKPISPVILDLLQ